MKKEEFNNKFRRYTKDAITLNQEDRGFVAEVYKSFESLLGSSNTIQIGSYPRFTAIRPLHDLDILYILGDWDEQNNNPQKLLGELFEKVRLGYVNPTNCQFEVSLQTHSVTIVFKFNSKEVFSVDIVPAYIFSKNEFTEDTYRVPEVLRQKDRKAFYAELLTGRREMEWIHSDPRGYIQVARQINQANGDFRKTVKFVKAWKNSCKKNYDQFGLKSFHIEQVITKFFQSDNNLTIYDGIFKFFYELPQIIKAPQIQDRASRTKCIDAYLDDLSQEQKERITQARDGFLINLENFSDHDNVEDLIKVCFYKRSASEEFLFDKNISVLTDDSLGLEIGGWVWKKDGFRDGWLYKVNRNVVKDRKIEFKIIKDVEKNYSLWKVQNDKNSPDVPSDQIRGELNKDQTRAYPEYTAYRGSHYVECYAILNNVCIARAKQNVIIT